MASNTYHHGNLKQALVDEYLNLLREMPVEQISLRKLASRVGVAATAVYNHFSDKMELVVAAKIRCLIHFSDYLQRGYDPRLSPKERISNLSKAYFLYSDQHRQHFNTIFNVTVEDRYVTNELVEVSMAAERTVRSAIVDLLKEHHLPVSPENEALGVVTCWSMAHGLSCLTAVRINHAACATGRWPEEFLLDTREATLQIFDAIATVIVDGILSAVRKNCREKPPDCSA